RQIARGALLGGLRRRRAGAVLGRVRRRRGRLDARAGFQRANALLLLGDPPLVVVDGLLAARDRARARISRGLTRCAVGRGRLRGRRRGGDDIGERLALFPRERRAVKRAEIARVRRRALRADGGRGGRRALGGGR